MESSNIQSIHHPAFCYVRLTFTFPSGTSCVASPATVSFKNAHTACIRATCWPCGSTVRPGAGAKKAAEAAFFRSKPYRSMAEVAHAGKHHRHAALIRRVDDFLVAHRAAGLDDAAGACVHHHVQAVAEGEEGIAGDRRALQ